MIPLPQDASPSDIDQWCTRGVVMVQLNPLEPAVPAFYASCDQRRVIGITWLSGASDRVNAKSVSVHWPRCGSVNLPGLPYAVHAERRAQRQYRRTWHVSGMHVRIPRLWDVTRFLGTLPGGASVPMGELAKACFFPTYYPYEEAERFFEAEAKVSVALTPRVIVAGDRSGKRMFYYNGVLSATAQDGVLYPVGHALPMRKITKLLDGRYHVSEHI